MRHLTGDELVDLAEGVVRESDVPHVAACAACRQQLTDLRAAFTMAAEATVPEPSPLFWDHFSSRVREAVAAQDGTSPSRWRRLVSWPGMLAPISALAAAMIVLGIVFAPRPPTRPDAAPPVVPSIELLSDSISPDDQSLTLVAELTDALGSDAAADAGLTVDGSAEHAVTHMGNDELLELQRLLKDALAKKGV